MLHRLGTSQRRFTFLLPDAPNSARASAGVHRSGLPCRTGFGHLGRRSLYRCRKTAPCAAGRDEIESVWAMIREGQDFDRSRFSDSGALPLSDQELDRYIYLVAGCVGEFWTRLCAKKMPGFSSQDVTKMTALGIRFGKGLQLVNILRDRSADFAKGRIYVTAERFSQVLEDARAHLLSAREYVRALRNYRLRVACALPLLLANETLDLIAADPSARRPKVSRRRVWVLLARAVVTSMRAPFRLPA
jgi:farnesyl-diphosphate farnesyltransferase